MSGFKLSDESFDSFFSSAADDSVDEMGNTTESNNPPKQTEPSIPEMDFDSLEGDSEQEFTLNLDDIETESNESEAAPLAPFEYDEKENHLDGGLSGSESGSLSDGLSVDDFFSSSQSEFIPVQIEPEATPEPKASGADPIVDLPETVQEQPTKRPRVREDSPREESRPQLPVAESTPEPEVAKPEPALAVPAPDLPADTLGGATLESLPESSVTRIIATLDALRSLDAPSQKLANLYITDGSPVQGEAALVLAALTRDRQLLRTMEALIEARALEQVDRAFFILSLDDVTFNEIGETVASANPEHEVKHSENRLTYARALVDAIKKLDDNSMIHVRATVSLLEAGELRED